MKQKKKNILKSRIFNLLKIGKTKVELQETVIYRGVLSVEKALQGVISRGSRKLEIPTGAYFRHNFGFPVFQGSIFFCVRIEEGEIRKKGMFNI